MTDAKAMRSGFTPVCSTAGRGPSGCVSRYSLRMGTGRTEKTGQGQQHHRNNPFHNASPAYNLYHILYLESARLSSFLHAKSRLYAKKGVVLSDNAFAINLLSVLHSKPGEPAVSRRQRHRPEFRSQSEVIDFDAIDDSNGHQFPGNEFLQRCPGIAEEPIIPMAAPVTRFGTISTAMRPPM